MAAPMGSNAWRVPIQARSASEGIRIKGDSHEWVIRPFRKLTICLAAGCPKARCNSGVCGMEHLEKEPLNRGDRVTLPGSQPQSCIEVFFLRAPDSPGYWL